MTLRLRLTAWNALAFTATLLVIAVVFWLLYGAALRRGLDEVLQATASAEVDVLEVDPNGRPDPGTLPRGIYIVILDSSGALVHATAGAPAVAPHSLGLSTLQVRDGASDAVYAAPAQDGRTVVAGSTLAEIDRNLRSLAETMALAGGALIVLSVLGGWWLVGRALAPVSRLAREADAIGSSELDRRLAGVEGDDELGALARTLNRMLARVEASVRRQRAFVVGASHDLRTPLAALRTELELALRHPADGPALRAAVEAAHADAVRLSELANGLLRLAADEPDGRRLDCEDVHLSQLIRGGVELVTASASVRNVAIEVTAPDVLVHVDPSRLVQAIANLLANAARFAPAESAVELTAELGVREATRVLRVEVLDRGPGVSPDFRSSLFEPFARARSAGSPGSGLGLATAAAAVHAHGGTIGYEDRQGGGARFWFWIPA
ncbi:MAG: HAMP domain-containing histidine kinase [Chloroflexi bacterium]|nr:HAMP domain-containing histidine kinase [Chloroflexota bacterium]